MKKIRITNLADYTNYARRETILDCFCNNYKKYMNVLENPQYVVSPTIIYFLEQFSAEKREALKSLQERQKMMDLYNRLCSGRPCRSIYKFKKALYEQSETIIVSNLFQPIIEDMDITLLDIYRFDRLSLGEMLSGKKLVLSKELHQLIKVADREERVHSAHWFVLRLNEIKKRNQKMKNWKKFLMQVEQENRTILIHDPIQEIDQHMQISLAELYFQEYRFFTMVLEAKRILISRKVLYFFQNAMPPHHMPLNDKEVKERWNAFDERYKCINCAEKLLKKTRRGRLVWEKVKDSRTDNRRDFRFVTHDEGHNYIFNVYATKSDTNNWYCSYELLEDNYHDSEFPALYTKLFKLVMECAKVPVKEEYAVQKTFKGPCKRLVVNQTALLVRTHIFRCRYDDHDVEDVIGEFSVLSQDGSIHIETAEAAYCPVCGCFFIHEYEYERLTEKGVVLCQVLENETYRSDRFHDYSSMKAESLLMQNGYTVKSQNALTEAQRRTILKNVIDTGVLSKAAVISYLQLFIKQKENLPLCETAVEKWREDLEYVKQLEIICE